MLVYNESVILYFVLISNVCDETLVYVWSIDWPMAFGWLGTKTRHQTRRAQALTPLPRRDVVAGLNVNA